MIELDNIALRNKLKFKNQLFLGIVETICLNLEAKLADKLIQ